MFEGLIELDKKELQDLAIKVDRILREEIKKSEMKCGFEARVYNQKAVGVQGDQKTYEHIAEIILKEPKYLNGSDYSDKDFYAFLRKLSTRITNEVKGVNKVVRYVLEGDKIQTQTF